MSGLLTKIAQHADVLILVQFALIIGLGIVVALMTASNRRVNQRWATLLKDERGDSLESLLYEHLQHRDAIQAQLDDDERRLSKLEMRLDKAVRHVGLVRFDAFEDVGGNQSFALAFFDDNGDGAIITSLLGRNECRVYCKPITRGRTERTLSQEEQRAMEDAVSTAPKAIVS
ncbi:MAG TPA: DUF4446 family protein [Fimbriimonadaceae bacterium]|nr:DUF4446 family protein [Fimbriimonadaceae bacterium]